MHEEVTDRDELFPSAAEFREVARHVLVEPQPAAIDENHRAGGRGDDFGERRQIIHRSFGVDRDSRLPIQRAVASLPHDAAAPANDYGGAGKAARGNAPAHHFVDGGES